MAGFPRSRRLPRPAHSAADGGGRRRFGGVASTSVAVFAFRVWLWVLWPVDDRSGCSGPQFRLSESARAGSVAGFPIPADNIPNVLARVCDSEGKSPAWRGLDAAFPSHFVVQFRGRGHRRRNEQHCELSGFGVCPRTEAQTVPGSAARIQSRYGPGERRSWSLTEGQPAVRQLQPMAFRIVW